MTVSNDAIRAFADALHTAETTTQPIAPLTESDATLDVDAAYEIQRRNIERRLEAGEAIAGRKIGLTSKPMQDMLGVNEPDYGVVLDSMVVDSGEEIDISELIEPRIEAEIAFILDKDLTGPRVTTAQVLRAIGGAVASLEVIDSRVEGWRIKLADTVADNASSARIVLASQIVPLDGLDLRLAGVVVSRNGVEVEVGAGAAVLGHPARCVAWLANKLAQYGDGLKAGDIVMSGALHRAIPVAAGDSFLAEFTWLGPVAVRFSA